MTSFDDRVDPEIAATMPPDMDAMFAAIGPDTMGPIREAGALQNAEVRKAMGPFPGRKEEVSIPGLNGAPDITGYFYRADDLEFPDAILVWLHGGGYVLGDADDLAVLRYASMMPILSVDYRMAPEWRAPAATEDNCAAIDWVVANAEQLGIDPAKIIVGGPSAGGGLAASTALMNRDRGGPPILFQLLIYPMLDDTHDTPSGHMEIDKQFWHRDVSMIAWSMYAEEGGASQYAAPTRATDLSGLPPAYIAVGDLDLFRDEDIDYAQRLMAEGIPVDLAVFPGGPHGFDMFCPAAELTQRMMAHQFAILRNVLGD